MQYVDTFSRLIIIWTIDDAKRKNFVIVSHSYNYVPFTNQIYGVLPSMETLSGIQYDQCKHKTSILALALPAMLWYWAVQVNQTEWASQKYKDNILIRVAKIERTKNGKREKKAIDR